MLSVSELSDRRLLIATATTVATALVLRYLVSRPSNADSLPVPDSTLPILGNTLDVTKYQSDRMHDWITEESLKTGGKPWVLSIIGRPTAVVITSPSNFEDIVKFQEENFPLGQDSLDILHDFLGRGLIVAEDRDWVFQRKVSSYLFTMKMMQDVMQEAVREKVAVLCKVLDARLFRGENVISLKRELMHFTSDVFSKVGFGVELNCLETGLNGKTHKFVDAFADASRISKMRYHLPRWWWKFQRYLGIGMEGELQRAMKIVNDFTYKVINESLSSKKDSNSTDPAPRDLISLFLSGSTADELAEIANGDPQVEMTFIRDMAINFIFAGKDTTSVAMGWFIVAMNQNPDVLAKIREEMREFTPQLFDSAAEIPLVEALKPLVYLDAAIRENVRLYSPAPSNARVAAQDIILRDGTHIKKGSRMMLSIYASARQPSVWGPDAAEFKPERWIDPKTNSIRQISPMQAFSFSAGRRICPGRSMALMEMKVALAVLLSRYDFKTIENPWEIGYEIAITHMIKGPFMVKVSSLAARGS